LRQVFSEIPDPAWRDAPLRPGAMRLEAQESAPVRAPLPPVMEPAPSNSSAVAPIQLVAQQQRGSDSPRG